MANQSCNSQLKEVDVTFTVPVFNERAALRETLLEALAALDRLGLSYEVIVVDDGSTDACLDTIADLQVRIFRHARRMGAMARMTAMRFARGALLVQSDADATYPLDVLPQMLAELKNCDLVIGARRKESATDWTLLRVAMKWALRKGAELLTRSKIPDLNSGLRAYRPQTALRYAHLYPKGHSIMSTMTIAFLINNLQVRFVEIDYRVRKGRSSFRPIADTYNYLMTIVRTVATFDPLSLFMPTVLVVGMFSAALTARNLLVHGNLGVSSVLAWVLTLLLFALGVLSDQLARLSRQLSFQKPDCWPDSEIEELTLSAEQGRFGQ